VGRPRRSWTTCSVVKWLSDLYCRKAAAKRCLNAVANEGRVPMFGGYLRPRLLGYLYVARIAGQTLPLREPA
jgi:hypothetical protein